MAVVAGNCRKEGGRGEGKLRISGSKVGGFYGEDEGGGSEGNAVEF